MESQAKGKDGILEEDSAGVKGGHKTIFQRVEEEESGEDDGDVEVIDDYGANRDSKVQ